MMTLATEHHGTSFAVTTALEVHVRTAIGCVAMAAGMAGIVRGMGAVGPGDGSSHYTILSVSLTLAAVFLFVGGLMALAKREFASLESPLIRGAVKFRALFERTNEKPAVYSVFASWSSGQPATASLSGTAPTGLHEVR